MLPNIGSFGKRGENIPQVEELTRRILQLGREIPPDFWRQGDILPTKAGKFPKKPGIMAVLENFPLFLGILGMGG